MRAALPLLIALLLAACDAPKAATRPVPTPGPQIAVVESSAASGTTLVSRGERIRFTVIGTGAGTHFSGATFLDSRAFSDLAIVAVQSSSRVVAQGTISVAAGAGKQDLAAVTGSELALDPWAFEVAPGELPSMGRPPNSVTGALVAGGVDLLQILPKDSAARTLVVRLRRDPAGASNFHPSLELYSATGSLLAAPVGGCAAIPVASRAPIVARVADPSRHAGRYTLASSYGIGDSLDCAVQ